ncbi:MAG: CoA transferase, partial [Aquincola tertiaricarbonis]
LQNARECLAFSAMVLQQPGLAVVELLACNVMRSAAREALRALIVEAFAALTAEQVVQRLEDAQIANANVNTMSDVWVHPQLQARQRWTEVATPAGPVPTLLPPGVRDAQDAGIGPVPALGAHTEAVLAELGFAADDIQRLRAERAV